MGILVMRDKLIIFRESECKGPDKQGHIVADTLLPTQMFPRLPARATFVADTNFVSETQKMFLICSETFCVRNKCFPVCAAQETSWATMCPQQCVLVYQGLKKLFFVIRAWPEGFAWPMKTLSYSLIFVISLLYSTWFSDSCPPNS